jgi:hypothetical protein
MTPDVSSAVPVQDTQALMDFEFAGSAGLGAAGAGAAGAAGVAGLVAAGAAGAAGVTEAAAAAVDTTAPTVLLAGDAPVTVVGLPAAAAEAADAELSLELPPQAASASASVRETVHGAPARSTSGQGFAPGVAARRVDETA